METLILGFGEVMQSSDVRIPVVGIGASAGGLEAVSELLGALPAATGMAFLLVQHLDPHHESFLTEILAKKAAIRSRPRRTARS